MATTERPEHSSPAPAPQPRRRREDAKRTVARLFRPFWVIPALSCVAALGVGIAAPEVDQQLSTYVPFLFPAGTDGARTMLSTIAGAMISLTGLVFSITIVVLQLASSQFSPRVLRTYLDERIPQVTLGVFAASFVYALTVLRTVSGTVDGQPGEVPQIAVTVAFLLVLASVGMFLAFIHHITQSISVEVIVQAVGSETRDLLASSRTEAERPSQGGSPEGSDSTHTGDAKTTDGASSGTQARDVVVVAPRHGYLNYVDAPALVEAAAGSKARVAVLRPLGSFLVEGQPMAVLHPTGEGQPASEGRERVAAAVSLTSRRSMEQDITFGVRQLVDIAERALSPGINDPTTAVQVLNELHTILRLIAIRPDLPTHHRDEDGVVRLVTCEWTFAQFLDLCIDEIAHWGAGTTQVPRRIEEMLTHLESVAQPEHRTSVVDKAAQVRRMVAQESR